MPCATTAVTSIIGVPVVSVPTKDSSKPPKMMTTKNTSTLFTACITIPASRPPVRQAAMPEATARQPRVPKIHGSGLRCAAEKATVDTVSETISPTSGRAK